MEKIFAFNLKNNLIDIEKYFSNFNNKNLVKVIFLPSFLQLNEFFKQKNKKFELGVQNICASENISITGEISFSMLEKFNLSYVIVGHSERRKILCETNEMIFNKVKFALNKNLTPILCVGEKEFVSIENTFEFIKNQLALFDSSHLENIIIAYEPIYAIGTNQTCDSDVIDKVCKFIKDEFKPKNVLYGGSVNENNIMELNKIKNVDGYLIGKASLDIEKVNKIISSR